jgi:hypothetical protein
MLSLFFLFHDRLRKTWINGVIGWLASLASSASQVSDLLQRRGQTMMIDEEGNRRHQR